MSSNTSNIGSGLDFNAMHYGQAQVNIAIGSLINAENKLIMTQSDSMAMLSTTMMDSAEKQSYYTQTLGFVEGGASLIQAGANVGGAYLNASAANQIKNIGKTPFGNQLGNTIGKEMERIDTEMPDVNTKLSKGNVEENLPGSKLDTTQKKIDIALREKDALLQQQKTVTQARDEKMQELTKRLDEKNNVIQIFNASSNALQTVSRNTSQSIQMLEQAKQGIATNAASAIEKTRDSEAGVVQGLTGVNMYASFAELGRA
jgi:paraquat-inducible protein B